MIADTIFAPSTAPGRAGVAVVRISGPAAGAALRAVGGIKLPPPRRATLDRKSVVEGKSVSVRVDLGGRRTLKNKRRVTSIDTRWSSLYVLVSVVTQDNSTKYKTD